MNTEALPGAVALAAAFLVGAHATWTLRKEYRAVKPYIKLRNRRIGQAFVTVSEVITFGVGYFGIMSIRSLLGFERFDWAPLVGLAVALPILLVPRYLLIVWRRVGRA